ncbi:MAG: TetM/TetW/TetO/TetS family tetracycline resistance ribosomal protection protein [Eubacteriales bacterium]|nr:TetM/TetW/TetO/TetS family tetracycline resistance ribosomal protection protein [Eubacteriales bacterium]
MKKTIGVVAHVDAGKTTFSERVLYLAHAIRALGRVDHQDAFLDAHPLEKQRGITIFSGQARFHWGEDEILWLDTPGHADFSPEMERALAILDYAVLLVSAAESVQSHTETLWRLLEENRVPTVVFLNKMDRDGANPESCIADLKRLSPDMLDLRDWQQGEMPESAREEIAGKREDLLERLFSTGYEEETWTQGVATLLGQRQVFPIFAGSGLTGEGVEGFMRLLSRLTPTRYQELEQHPFTAKVSQIRRDAKGGRVCFFKLTGGTLAVKDEIQTPAGKMKINECRLYHGERYQTADRVTAGELVGVPGLEGIKPGDLLGENHGAQRLLFHTEPMLAADVLWDDPSVSSVEKMRTLRLLEEEEPTLRVEERQGTLSVHVMGRIQLEIIQSLMKERYGLGVRFGPCRVLYQETLAAPCVGVGHYEPLRHYAEVHLRLKPGKRGSGITFRSLCHVDTLTLNWQRLIETHVMERVHKGVLCGEPLTDVEVELLSGKAHLKHTEGGDFRQATYRAIRNGLMYGQSVLLEPVCRFRLRIPKESCGKVTGDLMALNAQLEGPEYFGDSVLLCGLAVYARMMEYQESFLSATHGKGSFDCRMDRYAPCHNTEEVVRERGYNPLADDTPDSVFCQKGAGYNVPWDQVRQHAHLAVEEP